MVLTSVHFLILPTLIDIDSELVQVISTLTAGQQEAMCFIINLKDACFEAMDDRQGTVWL